MGESDITNFILLSKARQTLKVPFIASGGFADGQGLAAALCLGAEGINMGTRFLCTVESPIHENIKKQIVKADEADTALVMRRWKNTTRLYRNRVTEAALKVEQESKTGEFAEIAPFVSGKRGREVFVNGDPEFGVSCLITCALSYPHHIIPYHYALFLHRAYLITRIHDDRSGLLARLSVSSTISRPARNSCRGSKRRPRRR